MAIYIVPASEVWCTYSVLPLHAANCSEYLLRCPMNQTIPLGDSVTLYCELEQTAVQELGLEVDWSITVGNDTYNALQLDFDQVERWNFSFTDDDEINGDGYGTNLTLTVVATTENNNSIISCRIVGDLAKFIDTTLTTVGK